MTTTPKIYSLRNYLSLAVHFGLTGAMMVGSYLFNPGWAVVVSAGLVASAAKSAVDTAKKMGNYLAEHDGRHRYSPNLGKIVKELYQASGLDAKKYPVYNFKMKDEWDVSRKESESEAWKTIKSGVEAIADTPNAAAVNFDKPVIMISEPLLEILDDAEEKAALAHEFAHAVAGHNRSGLLQSVGGAMAAMSSGLFSTATMLGAGLWGVLSGCVAAVAASLATVVLHPKGLKLFLRDEDELEPKEAFERTRIAALASTFSKIASVGYVSYYYVPAYAGVWLTAKAVSLTASFLSSSLSRSHEYQADRGAVKLGANPLALITCLRKITDVSKEKLRGEIGEENMAKPGSLRAVWQRLKASHPTLDRRIARLSAIARESGYSNEDIDRAVHGRLTLPSHERIPLRDIRMMLVRFCGPISA